MLQFFHRDTAPSAHRKALERLLPDARSTASPESPSALSFPHPALPFSTHQILISVLSHPFLEVKTLKGRPESTGGALPAPGTLAPSRARIRRTPAPPAPPPRKGDTPGRETTTHQRANETKPSAAQTTRRIHAFQYAITKRQYFLKKIPDRNHVEAGGRSIWRIPALECKRGMTTRQGEDNGRRLPHREAVHRRDPHFPRSFNDGRRTTRHDVLQRTGRGSLAQPHRGADGTTAAPQYPRRLLRFLRSLPAVRRRAFRILAMRWAVLRAVRFFRRGAWRFIKTPFSAQSRTMSSAPRRMRQGEKGFTKRIEAENLSPANAHGKRHFARLRIQAPSRRIRPPWRAR